MAANVQDRTGEFRAVLQQAQKKRQQNAKQVGQQRQALLTESQRQQANGHGRPARPARSEFARNAAEIGRGITGTMEKLGRLAELARKRSLFDDRPVEINELTYVIKQDLSSLNAQISALQSFTKSTTPRSAAEQEGEHNKNVVVMLQGKLADVGVSFKEVLEVRTKNLQASRNRTENFVSTVSAQANPAFRQSASPLYNVSGNKPRNSQPEYMSNANTDILNLDPSGPSHLDSSRGQSNQQLMLMEEAQPQNSYINMRGEAIDMIERTINELGGVFGQLAAMVSEQGEQIQRIDANTEDVVDNVQGAQRELMKYWSRVSGNRWLVAKMFGILMIFFLLWVLVAG